MSVQDTRTAIYLGATPGNYLVRRNQMKNCTECNFAIMNIRGSGKSRRICHQYDAISSWCGRNICYCGVREAKNPSPKPVRGGRDES
jgi:hypothetical protein